MPAIEVSQKRPSELTASEQDAWRMFVLADPALGSPYFALEFAQCCEEARSDTRVLIASRRGQPVAFLPLQTGRLGFARPLAGPLGDVHGVIAEPGFHIDPKDLLRRADIPVFQYHGALASQAGFRSGARDVEGSWVMGLSQGYASWESSRQQLAPKAMRNLRARRRRLEELEGGFSFVIADCGDTALHTLLRWKSEQYRRTGVFDAFSVSWIRNLLEAVLRRQSDLFTGICSTLYINGEIAAVHVGMATEKLSHYWFPAYNPDYAQFSPGLLLLLESARHAPALGCEGIELGPGDYGFKKDLGTYQVGLVAGSLGTQSIQNVSQRVLRRIAGQMSRAPLGALSRWPQKALNKVDRLSGFYAV